MSVTVKGSSKKDDPEQGLAVQRTVRELARPFTIGPAKRSIGSLSRPAHPSHSVEIVLFKMLISQKTMSWDRPATRQAVRGRAVCICHRSGWV